MKNNDKLKQFVSLREQLLQDRAELEARLVEINKALGAVSGPVIAAVAAPVAKVAPVEPVVKGKPGRKKAVVAAPAPAAVKPVKPVKPVKARRGGKRAKNQMSLRDAVLAVTKARPLTRQEVLAGVQKLGYVFAAKDPLNSLSTLLYTDKGIKNNGGKFGPV